MRNANFGFLVRFKNSVNWIYSLDELDTPTYIKDNNYYVPRVSAGNRRFEWSISNGVYINFQSSVSKYQHSFTTE